MPAQAADPAAGWPGTSQSQPDRLLDPCWVTVGCRPDGLTIGARRRVADDAATGRGPKPRRWSRR